MSGTYSIFFVYTAALLRQLGRKNANELILNK
jgi:hypothetical protein